MPKRPIPVSIFRWTGTSMGNGGSTDELQAGPADALESPSELQAHDEDAGLRVTRAQGDALSHGGRTAPRRLPRGGPATSAAPCP